MTKKEEDNVRRRSTIQVLEYARSLGAYNRYGKADIDKNIAWLKKQGETSPILSNSSNTGENEQKSNENKDEMIKTDILNDLKIIKLYKHPVISNSSNTETINKEPTDKIEPKFKVGDWIVFVKSGSTYQVEKIENYKYTLKHIFGSSFCLSFSDENLIREWTIKDAKDGDILTCGEDIFLFKSYSALQDSISLSCWYNGQTNNFFNDKAIYVSLNKRNKICPATKEQRDILYQKIKEEKNNNVCINKNIDLTNILKDCPKGTKFYSPLWGKISFERIVKKEVYTIEINTANGYRRLTKEGYYTTSDDAECIIFPSKDQRDWNKFTAPWYKKDKFNPKTLNPFDKVLVRDAYSQDWTCGFFSHIVVFDDACKYNVGEILYTMCIPYNDDTKHLVGTIEEAPEYYRYWED